MRETSSEDYVVGARLLGAAVRQWDSHTFEDPVKSMVSVVMTSLWLVYTRLTPAAGQEDR